MLQVTVEYHTNKHIMALRVLNTYSLASPLQLHNILSHAAPSCGPGKGAVRLGKANAGIEAHINRSHEHVYIT